MQSAVKHIKLSLSLLLCAFMLTACLYNDWTESYEQVSGAERLLYLALIQDPAPVAEYQSRAQVGLSSWQIDLDTGLSSNSRTTNTGFVMQPANWITTAGSSCNARGIPSEWQGGVCSLEDGVIGLCITRYQTSSSSDTDGKLLDTTLVILDSYQASNSVSNAEKQSVFTHEIGHCLGLAHTSSTISSCDSSSTVNVINYTCSGTALNCIMYFNTDGANTPNTDEVTAIQAAYQPLAAPTGSNKNHYSTSCTGSPHNALRHHSFPQFYISATIGSAFSIASDSVPDTPRTPMPVDYEIQVHAYHANGDFETRRYDSNYRLLQSTR